MPSYCLLDCWADGLGAKGRASVLDWLFWVWKHVCIHVGVSVMARGNVHLFCLYNNGLVACPWSKLAYKKKEKTSICIIPRRSYIDMSLCLAEANPGNVTELKTSLLSETQI